MLHNNFYYYRYNSIVLAAKQAKNEIIILGTSRQSLCYVVTHLMATMVKLAPRRNMVKRIVKRKKQDAPFSAMSLVFAPRMPSIAKTVGEQHDPRTIRDRENQPCLRWRNTADSSVEARLAADFREYTA